MKLTPKHSSCQDCSKEQAHIFQHLTEDELFLLDQQKHCNLYKKGDTIYHEGNRIGGCYCINKGVIKIYKTGLEGKNQIIGFAKSGDIIGYRSVLSNEAACTTTKVIEDSAVCFIPSDLLFQFVQNNSVFALNLLKITCRELEYANAYITDIAQKSVRERLAEMLLKLQDEFGESNDGYLQISLTRQEFANIIGTATETVIRLFSEFKNDNLIELNMKKIKLLDVNKLRRIANDM
ncbi:MAG: Crp/Fnr family transcriptional regulator [Bacteroidales bacterium]|jgi:CRP-like cAMP-binding protein|nr:Crp/Fnr family transcriptional regulator [Bacteroidales bacterium]